MKLLLVVDAIHANGRALDSGVNVTFALQLTAADGSSSTASLTPGQKFDLSPFLKTRPLKIDVTATVNAPRHWDLQASASLKFHALAKVEVLSRHADFEPPRVLSGLIPRMIIGTDVMFVRYFVSRVKDATTDVLATLKSVPAASRPPQMSQDKYDDDVRPDLSGGAWNITQLVGPAPTGLQLVTQFDTSANALVRSDVTYADFDTSVVSIKGQKAPGLVAMTWPATLKPTTTTVDGVEQYTIPTPHFFMYIHPPGTVTAPAYDKDWGHLYASLWRDMNFVVRPSRKLVVSKFSPQAGSAHVQDPFMQNDGESTGKGVAYQVAASGKTCVYLQPLVNTFGEGTPAPDGLPSLMMLSLLRELLEELQGYAYRRANVYAPLVPLGGLAISSFSRGSEAVTDFVAGVASDSFFSTRLREFILFDPPHGPGSSPKAEIENVVNTLVTWAAGDPNRCVRVYARTPVTAYANLIPNQTFTAPLVADSSDGRHTVVLINATTFQNTLTPLWSGASFDPDPHNRTPAAFVLHALQRSRFTAFVP